MCLLVCVCWLCAFVFVLCCCGVVFGREGTDAGDHHTFIHVCLRERDMCVRVFEKEEERRVCVFEREWAFEREQDAVCVRERERVCVAGKRSCVYACTCVCVYGSGKGFA